VSDTDLREALEDLIQQKESEPDRRPRDKYGPIGRKPEPAIRVSVLRDLLAAHPADPALVECICARSEYEPYGIIPNPECPEYNLPGHKKRNP
jgi:hypothetical protein